MKNELKERFKSDILLSQFDLSEQNLSEEWFNGFFTNPISQSLNILDKEQNWIKSDLYLGFDVIKEPSGKMDRKFYISLNNKIKENILKEWDSCSQNKPLYKFFPIKSDEDGFEKFIYIYLSPKKTNKLFDFKIIQSKDSIIATIFDMLMAAYLIERVNKRNPLNIDICLGKIFLNPLINEDNDEVMVFEYKFKLEDSKLKFILKHQVYELKNISVDKYDDVCSLNNYRYSNKLDAREYTREFLDFMSFSDLKDSKFITHAEFYKDVLGMLDNFGINYLTTTFKPEYLFNQFPLVETDVHELLVYMSTTDKNAYENHLIEKNIPHNFDTILKYLETSFNLSVKFIENPSLDIIIKNKETPCLYLMFGKAYQDKYVTLKKDNDKVEKLSDVITSFVGDKLYELNHNDFLTYINSYDTYSQVKLYNLYANNNELIPIISQGLILKVKNVFARSLNAKNPPRLNKKTGKPPSYPNKETICKFEKVISELDIKKKLYLDKQFSFKTTFSELDGIEVKNIKLINMLANKKGRLYSFVNLDKDESSFFKVTKNKIFIGEQVNELCLSVNWRQELNLSDSVIVINDDYLIRVKDNDLMPSLIMEKNRFNVQDKDICFKIEEQILANNSKGSCEIKSTKDGVNYFYPYNLPQVGTMIGKENIINLNETKGYSNCIFNMNGNEINAFMTLRDQPINTRMPRNNRLESIGLFKFKDFMCNKENWCDNEQLMYFYLSSISFNYMLSGGITKKSLLTKLGDVVLLN